MISVSIVRPEELSHAELTLIVKYCNRCFEPVSFEDLVRRIRDGLACVYRFDGDTTGIFILAYGDGGIYVETVAGEKVIKHFDQIHDKIRMVASACGARKLYSYVSRDALARVYDRRTKAKPVATLYCEEL